MSAVACPCCRGPVELHQGQPQITDDGAVVLWCRACWASRGVVAVEAGPPPPPPRAPRRSSRYALTTAVAASAALAIACAQWAAVAVTPEPPPAMAGFDPAPDERPAEPAAAVARERLPAEVGHVDTLFEASFPVPIVDGTALDVRFPSLRLWTHPVTRSAELIPELPSRLFGSSRIGVAHAECGEGHCGVDLDGPRGRALVAVADGTVVRVERHELGLDGRSGRYVRIEHDDGTLTSYMHLDDVADGLAPGDRILAGQYLGTLGASAVYAAPPHLHFSLEVPNHPEAGRRGDHTDTRYVDPAPFLVRSTIVATPDRRHATKPAL